ncbi:glucanotransferase domain of glycogen debranching enzyme-domain-containing protein [Mycena olivaceomarginata]|nr:glucanotransferase domain of glycogen debranching enzyme-domain-containing protein [Mycena olivaceomarginata]
MAQGSGNIQVVSSCPYFTRLAPTTNVDPLVYSLANNGWIWAADPLKNFVELPSKCYFQREVIVWGDCVKLQYGSGPSANPWLWSPYVESLPATFDGFRIHNCHSTPLHVSIALLDAARVLFTGNEETDTVFVKRLGISFDSGKREWLGSQGAIPFDLTALASPLLIWGTYRVHGCGVLDEHRGACVTDGQGPRAKEVLADLNLVDLNVLLHCADSEERDASGGEFGVYDVPGLGKMMYCGLEGWIHQLRRRELGIGLKGGMAWTDAWPVYKDVCVVCAGLPMGLGACCGNSLGSYSAGGGE